MLPGEGRRRSKTWSDGRAGGDGSQEEVPQAEAGGEAEPRRTGGRAETGIPGGGTPGGGRRRIRTRLDGRAGGDGKARRRHHRRRQEEEEDLPSVMDSPWFWSTMSRQSISDR